MNPHIQNRWHGWQASRAALKVELPERRSNEACRNHPASRGFNAGLDAATEAIQQAGIEVVK